MVSGSKQLGKKARIVRRRRLMVFAGFVGLCWLVIALIFASISGGNKGGGAAGDASGGDAKGAPSASASPNAIVYCDPALLTVEAHVGTAKSQDKSTFVAPTKPYLWFTIQNIGAASCTFNYKAATTYFTITSGSDRIWSNKDCSQFAKATDAVFRLDPGVPQASKPIAWDRVRSSADTGCVAKGNKTALPGAYNLVATVSGVKSEKVQYLLR